MGFSTFTDETSVDRHITAVGGARFDVVLVRQPARLENKRRLQPEKSIKIHQPRANDGSVRAESPSAPRWCLRHAGDLLRRDKGGVFARALRPRWGRSGTTDRR